MLSRHSGYAFATTATPKGFFFSRVSYIFYFIVWDELLVGLQSSCSGLLYWLLSFCFTNSRTTLQRGARKGKRKSSDSDFYLNLAVLLEVFETLFLWSCSIPPSFAGSCHSNTNQLECHCNNLQITICHNLILCLTASSQKVGGEYGMWEKGACSGKPRISDGNIQALIHHTDSANTVAAIATSTFCC
jgi:hypothetical protein